MLWLWRRLAAPAPVRPLAWEPPYAVGAALKRKRRREGGRKKGREGGREEILSLALTTDFEELMVTKGNRLVGGMGWKFGREML